MASPGRAPRALIFIEDGSFIYDNRVKREVRTLEGAGFEVSVVCPRYPGERWADDVGRTHVYRYPKLALGGGIIGHAGEYASSLLLGGLLSLWIALRRGFDVLQLCNPPDFLFPVAVFFKLFGKRYIFDHHDLCPELFASRYGGGAEGPAGGSGLKARVLGAVLRWSERRSWRFADAVISTNESYRQAAIRRGGVAPEHVVVVRNGPDLERFKEWSEAARKDTVRVGYIGNMNPQDGVDYLLRAARHLRRDLGRRDIEFVLIGAGDSFPALKALAEELGVAGAVRFTGRISDEDVHRELSACDVCCQPDPRNALNDVSTMNKAMEYMALAKPVVAFDLVETRVSCGDAALYAGENDPVKLAELILRLADDFELRREMGLRGRKRIEERLAWKYSEAPYLAVYRRVLGREGAAGANEAAGGGAGEGRRAAESESEEAGAPGRRTAVF
jgi:glycosyltransferase involved in cell wall biosynthesis